MRRTALVLSTVALTLTGPSAAFAAGPVASTAKARFGDGAAHPARGGGAVVEWHTTREKGNVGFVLYRARKRSPHDRARLIPQMVAGTVIGLGKTRSSRLKRTYRRYDPTGHRGDRYYVRSVDVRGRTKLHGPYVVRGKRVRRGKNSPLLPSPSAAPNSPPGTPSGTTPVNTTPVVESGTPVPTVTPAPTIPPTTPAPVAQDQLASHQTVRLGVDRTGWTSVDLSVLGNRGIDVTRPANLHVFTGGHEVAALVRNGSLEFYGQAVDTRDTATRAYFVEAQTGPGLRITPASGRADSSGPDSFTAKAVYDDRSKYFYGLTNGDAPNFFGGGVTSSGANFKIVTTHVASATRAASLTVTVQGVTTLDHSVTVMLNGDTVGTINSSGQASATQTFSVPGVGEGTNTVRLVTSGQTDVVLAGQMTLQYDHDMTADNDGLTLSVPGGSTVSIGGFSRSGARVMDVTDPDNPQELNASSTASSVTAPVPGSGSRRLVAFTPNAVQAPATVDTGHPSDLDAPDTAGAFTIITPSAYFDSLQPLVAQRRSEGLTVAVVGLQDIYDEYSYGQADRGAVTAFLNDARSTWAVPPQYVLLGGDASYDPRGYEGRGTAGNVVPTAMIDTTAETPSDSTLTGTLATGRFPARSPAQMTGFVNKTLAYGAQASTGSALLVSDLDDTWSFSGSSDALKPLLPSSWATTKLQRSQPSPRAALLAGLDTGPSVVNYAGHGSVDIWRGNLLTDADAAGIQNTGKLSFFVFMTCLNGYFVDPQLDALAESLLRAPNAGVAVFSSTTTTTPGPQESANQALFSALFDGPTTPRLGDAVIASLSAAGDPDVRRSWTLMGDPTLIIH